MRYFLQFLKPYRMTCVLIFFTVLLDVAGALLVPTVTAKMLNLAAAGAGLMPILHEGLIMLAISLMAGFGALWGSFLCARLSARLGRDMRVAVYEKSLSFSAADFERFGTASMVTRTLNDINSIQTAFVMCIQMVLPVPIMCILGIVFAFRIHPFMGYLVTAVVIFLLAAGFFIIRRAAPIFERLQRFLDRVNTVLRENITGVRVIRAFGKEHHEAGRLNRTFSDYADSAIRANRLFAALDSIANVSINLTVVAILYIGGNLTGAGAMEIGGITAVTEYAIWILFYIMMAQMVIIMVPRALVCIERMAEILSLEPEIQDNLPVPAETGLSEIWKPDSETTRTLNSETDALSGLSDRSSASYQIPLLSFDDVTFRFPDADEDTLSHLAFQCEKGTTTAIIGGTGSGKSTIAKLILRFHDVTSGQICLDGTDIRKLPQKKLRDAVSYVPQKAWLFSGTIEENLRYGNPNASEAELWTALDTAQAGFVYGLPEGLASHTAQGGTNFSGGQKQRLSIARALAKKSSVYIFDDSFSALDAKTDAALRHALKDTTKDAAVIIIAQRVSTILHADQILVLDDGKIAGLGTHSWLLEHCPVYKDIVRSQLRDA